MRDDQMKPNNATLAKKEEKIYIIWKQIAVSDNLNPHFSYTPHSNVWCFLRTVWECVVHNLFGLHEWNLNYYTVWHRELTFQTICNATTTMMMIRTKIVARLVFCCLANSARYDCIVVIILANYFLTWMFNAFNVYNNSTFSHKYSSC